MDDHEMVAEILYGLYGGRALKLLQQSNEGEDDTEVDESVISDEDIEKALEEYQSS